MNGFGKIAGWVCRSVRRAERPPAADAPARARVRREPHLLGHVPQGLFGTRLAGNLLCDTHLVPSLGRTGWGRSGATTRPSDSPMAYRSGTPRGKQQGLPKMCPLVHCAQNARYDKSIFSPIPLTLPPNSTPPQRPYTASGNRPNDWVALSGNPTYSSASAVCLAVLQARASGTWIGTDPS